MRVAVIVLVGIVAPIALILNFSWRGLGIGALGWALVVGGLVLERVGK